MKRFKTISTIFIIAIAVIFGYNVYYLVNLYKSTRSTIERDVMTAMADADIDELCIRAERAQKARLSELDSVKSRHGEISVRQDPNGKMVSSTKYADGRVKEEQKDIDNDNGRGLANKMIDEVGIQFHAVMDPYIPVNLSVMDSLLTKHLNDRYIFPNYISTEVVDSKGKVLTNNPQALKGDYDTFTYCFNPAGGLYYRVSMTPLTKHILSEMSGVVVTIFLLAISFSLAFWYLFRTVSRMRTIEEMKDDFVNNMTHELKTPIAIAYSANDALLNYDAVDDLTKKETYLKIANKQLKRLGELVENILAMSMERRKTMILNPEHVLLRPFVEEIAAAQRMRNDKDITINVDIDSSVYVNADKSHFSNVLNNLIDNAIKYSGDSVTITLSANSDRISVADNGIGIPQKALPYLFNKFYRVPHGNLQDVRGYGIGLYYVKSILDKMGWYISVRSKEAEGSVFTIKFINDEE